MVDRNGGRSVGAGRRIGVARFISKAGICSRTDAAVKVRNGQVRVNSRVVTDPEFPVRVGTDRVALDGHALKSAERIYLALNKPRGLVTSASDERGRDTVYRCFEDAGLPWIAPVGRLDRASEGLLLFSNDPEWSAWLASPGSHCLKTYHVQIDRIPDAALIDQLRRGALVDDAMLGVASVAVLRTGGRNAWLEVTLDEGRNRQIRRWLGAFDIGVLRLVRIGIGCVTLGTLARGSWRHLTAGEVATLTGRARSGPSRDEWRDPLSPR